MAAVFSSPLFVMKSVPVSIFVNTIMIVNMNVVFQLHCPSVNAAIWMMQPPKACKSQTFFIFMLR